MNDKHALDESSSAERAERQVSFEIASGPGR